MKIKNIRFPAFKDFSLCKMYGISKKCRISGYILTKPYMFHAICGWNDKYFEYSESGYEEAKKWLEETRILCLKMLGVEEEQNEVKNDR